MWEVLVTKKDILSSALKDRIVDLNVSLYEIGENEEISKIEKHILTEKVLIYKFGYIIPKNIIERHFFYNIHPGSIETNRGAHPVRWTILLGEKKTWMTLYQITGIDEGNVIYEEEIDAEGSDYIQLNQKMDQHLGIVLDQFIAFLEKGESADTILKEKGVYRSKVQEEDYTVDIVHDTLEVIDRKIKAVKDFGGAVITQDGGKYRVKAIEEKTKDDVWVNHNIHIAFERNGKGYLLICEEYKWK